jgi:hypothetical protein
MIQWNIYYSFIFCMGCAFKMSSTEASKAVEYGNVLWSWVSLWERHLGPAKEGSNLFGHSGKIMKRNLSNYEESPCN